MYITSDARASSGAASRTTPGTQQASPVTFDKRPETIAAANAMATDAAFGAVAPPLVLASSYAFRGFEKPRPHEYSRTSNPTRDQLADTIAKLESGAGAVIVSAGMAAVDLLLCHLRPGDRVVAPHDGYSGTSRLLAFRAERSGFAVQFVDQGDPSALAASRASSPIPRP